MADIKKLTTMAKTGSAEAEYELGELYYAGQSGVSDLEKHFLSEAMTELVRVNQATAEQERDLLFSSVLLTQNWQSAVILPLTCTKEAAQNLIADSWDIHDETDAVRVLGYLSIADGHAPELDEDYQDIQDGGIKNADFKTAEEILLGFGYTKDELMTLPSLAAWDYGRLGFIARYARQAGYINDAVAWDYIGRCGRNAAEVYDNWRQYLAAYVLGRALWGNDCMDLKIVLGFLFCSRQSPFRRGISLKPGAHEPAFDFTLYDGDFGVQQDYSEALRWYHRAAEQNHAKALFSIGYMYDNGQGVPQDYDMALQWYRKAADQNNIDAIFNIGYIYEYRKNDFKEAEKWYTQAAEKGDEDAPQALERLAEKAKSGKPKVFKYIVYAILAVIVVIFGAISAKMQQ